MRLVASVGLIATTGAFFLFSRSLAMTLHLNQRNIKYTGSLSKRSNTNMIPISTNHSAFPWRLSWGWFTVKHLEQRPPSYFHYCDAMKLSCVARQTIAASAPFDRFNLTVEVRRATAEGRKAGRGVMNGPPPPARCRYGLVRRIV